MKKITKNTILADILEVPGAKEILAKYHLPCLSCPLAQSEIQRLKLGNVCEKYDINAKDLIKELNQLL